MGHVDKDRFEVRLISGGWQVSEQLLSSLKTAIRHGTSFNMQLVEEDTSISMESSRSVALDTRSGEVFGYDPAKNSDRKQLSDLEFQLRSLRIGIPSQAELVYAPQ